jgi:hypothetical protein
VSQHEGLIVHVMHGDSSTTTSPLTENSQSTTSAAISNARPRKTRRLSSLLKQREASLQGVCGQYVEQELVMRVLC